MRVLLVNRFGDGSQIPTGRMLADVACLLAAQGHHVAVLSSTGNYEGARERGPEDGSSIAASGGNLPCVERVKLPTWMPRAGAWLWFAAEAWRRIPKMRWDVCVLMTDPPLLPLLAARIRRSNVHGRIVVWLMDLYPEALAAAGRLSEQSAAYRFILARRQASLAHADLLVCLGEAQRTRLQRASSARPVAEVVPPWDDRRWSKRVDVVGTRDLALYGGNLGEAHSFREILVAAAHLPEAWTLRFAVRGAKAASLGREVLGDGWRVTGNQGSRPKKGGATVEVTGYVSEEETPQLLASAKVHLITMSPGWEGIVVPSKLYGCVRTGRPVLFIGPEKSDTAIEIRKHGWGLVLPSGSPGADVAQAILELAQRPAFMPPVNDGAARTAELISRQSP
jgi:colanic acid biosynthesis glycosyl transferase WcaI